MNRNLVEIALQELGPEDRALLELAVVRGVSDGDIAGLLGVDVARVLIKREEALGRVSAMIDEDPEEVLRTLRRLPAARWRAGGEVRPPAPEPRSPEQPDPGPQPATPEPEPQTEPEPEPVATSAAPEPAGDRSRFMLALLGGLAITLAVIVVLALTGDDDPDSTPATSPPAGGGGRGALEPLGGSQGAAGTARIEQDGNRPRLVLNARGLPNPPRGGYVVWLYNSITDARAVGGARRGRFEIRARLPEGYRRYRFVDVSREAPDGNANHSGQSVLRVPVAGAAGG